MIVMKVTLCDAGHMTLSDVSHTMVVWVIFTVMYVTDDVEYLNWYIIIFLVYMICVIINRVIVVWKCQYIRDIIT